MQIDVDIIHNLEHCVGPVGPVIIAGGLQQYVNNNQGGKWRVETSHNVNVNVTTINELPDYILLEILSYMNARELCLLSRVCRHWYWISSDNILWGRRLQKDMRSWKVIKHTTNPHMFLGCQPEWHNKEIYLRCSPEINKVTQFSKQKFPSLGLIYQVFWPKKTPRIAIFGPGLESSTSQIIRKILEDRSKVFNVKGMFPGQFEGLGSGFTIKMTAHTFHLITLYTSSKKERESHHGIKRLHVNKLLRQQVHPHQEQQQADESGDGVAQYMVTNRVKELCQTIDGFIFVVDSSADSETVRSGQVELQSMVNEEWMKPDVPLAVLSCTPDTQTAHLPCVDVISLLQLTRFNRPWQIHHCVVEDMSGVPEAIEWLSESTAETGSLSLRELLKVGE